MQRWRAAARSGCASFVLVVICACPCARVAAEAPSPPPYSIPFQLRPAAIVNVVRSDSALAFYENPVNGNDGFTFASMLVAGFKLTDAFSPLVRLGVVQSSPPELPTDPAAPGDAFSFVNPALGGTYLFKLSPEIRLALFLGLTIPVGMGGGDSPDADVAAANTAGMAARSAMDNVMFSVNYLSIVPGVDLAYVADGLTVQGEATLLQLIRTRGENNPATQDAARTNLTMGLHVGYFVVPQLSFGLELRHQHWLTTPNTIEGGNALFTEKELRTNTTLAVGARVHLKLSETMWLRPALSYSRGLDDPMSTQSYDILQIDVPFIY